MKNGKAQKISIIATILRTIKRDVPTATRRRGVIRAASMIPRNCVLACKPMATLEWPWPSSTIAIRGMVSPNVMPKTMITEITAGRLRTVLDDSLIFGFTDGAAC
jgi:hypothetical protein